MESPQRVEHVGGRNICWKSIMELAVVIVEVNEREKEGRNKTRQGKEQR
jgi:hypothetical protein